MRAKRQKHSDQHKLTIQRSAPEKADSQIVAVGKDAKSELLESNPSVSVKKQREREEDGRISRAFEKMKNSSGIKAECLSDRFLVQTASAILPYWNSKDGTFGQRLEIAASALTEMEPSNATEAMLANQMIAVNDAALLFVNQATQREASSLEYRNANAERALKFCALFIQQADAMQRLKGKAGRQKVIVEHVNVHAGGQAIVGTVTPRDTWEGVGDDSENH